MQLSLQLTRDCNLACTYCYQRALHRPDVGMTEDTALRAIDFAARWARGRGESHIALTWFGGEPLLNRPVIERIMPRLRELGAAHGITLAAKVSTNGTLLDDEFARFARAHGLFISLSIDGTARAQDIGRPFKDGSASSSHAERALLALVRQKTPFCSYQVITPHNAGELARSVDWLHERGSRVLIASLDFGGDWTDAALATLARQYRALARRYVRWTRRSENFYLSVFDSKISAWTRGPSSRKENCSAGIRQLAVDPDGTIVPCVEFLGHREYAIGHIDTGLDRDRMREVGAAFNGVAPDECSDCGVRARCASACACLNHRLTGKLREVDALVCAHEKIVTLAADRIGESLWRRRDKTFIERQYDPSHHALSAVEDWVDEVLNG